MKKILCIDREQFILNLLRIKIEGRGYEMISSVDAEEGFQMAVGEAPDLIISEILLPTEESGYRFCQKIKGEKRTSKIPLILLTAKRKDPGASFTYNIWADDYIEKPFSPAELVPKMEALLKLRK